MIFSFTDSDAQSISNILGIEAQKFDNSWAWSLLNKNLKQPLVLTIYSQAQIESDNQGVLVSVQTQHGYFELHGVTAYMPFEPDEIIFVRSDAEKVSSLIIGKEGNCSLFSNIHKANISADFAQLDTAVLLSAMQLSLTEAIL
jgi:hypothetical protein